TLVASIPLLRQQYGCIRQPVRRSANAAVSDLSAFVSTIAEVWRKSSPDSLAPWRPRNRRAATRPYITSKCATASREIASKDSAIKRASRSARFISIDWSTTTMSRFFPRTDPSSEEFLSQQHLLYFFPLPHGHGAFRDGLVIAI